MNRVLTRILTQASSIRHVHTDIANPDFFQRALHRFPKECDLAFAYGSGVFQQDGNVSKSNMTDFIIVVKNSEEWHAENLQLNPKDYSGVMSMLGPKVISEVQDKFGAKCYFNTLIPFEDGLIKYGVINRSHIIADLLDWESLYIGGRLQKPVRMIQDCSKFKDPELHMALRMNLKNALHASFLLLPEKFSDKMLYNTLCGLSYKGDFRMAVGEDKNKVKKIAEGSYNELKQLYARELSKISEFVYIPKSSENLVFEQDMSPGARHFHLTMLPKNMQELLVRVRKTLKKYGYIYYVDIMILSRYGIKMENGEMWKMS